MWFKLADTARSNTQLTPACHVPIADRSFPASTWAISKYFHARRQTRPYPSRTKHGATHPVVPTISSPFSPASLLPPAMSSTTRLVPLRRPLFPPLNQVRYNTRSPDQERRTLRLHNRKRNHLEKPTKKTDGYTLAGHHADIVRRQLELGTQPLFPSTHSDQSTTTTVALADRLC